MFDMGNENEYKTFSEWLKTITEEYSDINRNWLISRNWVEYVYNHKFFLSSNNHDNEYKFNIHTNMLHARIGYGMIINRKIKSKRELIEFLLIY